MRTSRRFGRALGALVALFGGALASCSADVDGYRYYDPDYFGHAGTTGQGGDGAGGDTETGGGGGLAGSNVGGAGGQQILPDTGGIGPGGGDGAGGDVDAGEGGSGSGGIDGEGGAGGLGEGGAIGAGGTGDGGASSGGASNGGATSGGASNGGATSGGASNGGASAGGASSGGASNGGASAGGASAGGASAGGASAGGASAGGASAGGASAGGASAGGAIGTGGSGTVGSVDPEQVSTSAALTGITAAAWRPEQQAFYLLKAATNQFYKLDVSGDVSGPRDLPSGAVAPKAFGASLSDIFVVIGDSIVRVPQTGSTTAAVTVNMGDGKTPTSATGVWAGGYFFVAQITGASHALKDDASSLATISAPANAYGAETDGTNVVVRVAGSGTLANHAAIHLLVPPTFAPSSGPCDAGGLTKLDYANGVHQNTVAWVSDFTASPYQLKGAPVAAGVCGTVLVASYGTATTGGTFPGLIDDQYALVASLLAGSTADIQLKKLGGSVSRTLPGVYFGSKYPYRFVMGPPHHAVVISGDYPALIAY